MTPRRPPLLTLYVTASCGLCDEAREALERVRARVPFELEVRELLSEPSDVRLRHRYDVPALLWDGELLSRHRVDEGALEARLLGHARC